MRIEFAQSARKHRIGRARVRQVIAEPTVEITLPAEGDLDERLVFLGDDATGRALEVLAVRIERGLLVIHANGSPTPKLAFTIRERQAMTRKINKAPVTWTTASGAVISEDDAERLAAEFERDDAALDHGRGSFPRKAGRPSLTGRSAVSPQVTFRVTPQLRAKAEKLATERGTTVSGLAREALEEMLQRGA